MPTLRDGSVVPSHLGVHSPGTTSRSPALFGNVATRVGEVIEIIYRDDPRSVTKRFTEYSVLVQHRDGAGAGAAMVYGHCIVASLFGGAADFDTYTLRARSKDAPDATSGDGSKVLIACVNGDINSAFIFAAVRGGDAEPDPVAAAGHRAVREFNGVRQEIDRHGALKITARGATAANGELAADADPNGGGAELELAASGDAKIANGATSVRVKHSEEKVVVSASGGVTVNASGADVVLGGGRVLIGGPNASEALLKGTTHRQAEAARDLEVVSALGSASAAAAALAASATAGASALATSAVGLPPPAQASVAAAAAAFGTMAGSLSTIAQALGRTAAAFAQYESGAGRYLSLKNSTDG